MKKYTSVVLTLVVLSAGIAGAATTADVLFVVDESGSMGAEQTWLAGIVTDMETALVAAGVTGNQYGLVGYGASAHSSSAGHSHPLGSTGLWGDATMASGWVGGLVASGGTEDGWEAINFGLNNYTFRPDAGVNVILITDEDRDTIDGSLDYDGMLAALNRNNAMLNVVVTCSLSDDVLGAALGVDSEGNAYVADGSGGYNTGTAGQVNSAAGNTQTTYIDLAWATGGATWDIGTISSDNANTVASFNSAFVDVKVEEIEEQPTIPVPGALLLGSLGMGLAGWMRRRKVL